MRKQRLILVAAFLLLLQSGLQPAVALQSHGTPGQFLTEQASMPYQFSYFAGGHDGSHSRHETRDANGRVSGHYTLATDEGSQRVVCYVADEHGFRAWVDTNEPGTDNQDPADVSVRSTAPGTGGALRGPIKGVCGSPPPPAGPPAQTQILVTSPPVVIPPRKPAYLPPPVQHEEVIVPQPVVKVYPPPVQQVVVHPPARKTSYVPAPEPPTYVEQPPVRTYVRKVVVKRPIHVQEYVPPPQPVKTYYVPPPQPAKTYYVPPPQPVKTYYVPPPQPAKTYYVPSEPVVVTPPRRPPPTRRLSYQPAREEVPPPSRPTYYDTPPSPPARVQEVYVPSRPAYRPSSCSGYCGPKVTPRVYSRPEPPSYVKTSTGPASYSVRRGPYVAPRYEPWTESLYKTYRPYNEPQPWRQKGDVPIGVSYKMSISKGPGGPYPWQDEVVSRPTSYYRHAQPSPHTTYYRPAESAPEPTYPSSRPHGGYAKNDLQDDDDDDTYDFKRPAYG